MSYRILSASAIALSLGLAGVAVQAADNQTGASATGANATSQSATSGTAVGGGTTTGSQYRNVDGGRSAGGSKVGNAVRHPIRTLENKWHNRHGNEGSAMNRRDSTGNRKSMNNGSDTINNQTSMNGRDAMTNSPNNQSTGSTAMNDRGSTSWVGDQMADSRSKYEQSWDQTRDRAMAWVNGDHSSDRSAQADAASRSGRDAMNRPAANTSANR